jgi:multiple sugar transport system permease protein
MEAQNANPLPMNAVDNDALRIRTRRLRQLRNVLSKMFTTSFTFFLLALFLAPFAFMVSTSLKTQAQRTILGGPIWPAQPVSVEYNGKNVDVYKVPVNTCEGFSPEDKSVKGFGLVKKGLKQSTFIDPKDPSKGEFSCTLSWRATPRYFVFSPAWGNYTTVWNEINYPRLLWNTTFYALSTLVGTLLSCVLVAYGFARFRFPGRDVLFIILISTIFLPAAVTVIPLYTFFVKIHLVGTWLPLILPHYFANAYNVFLLRQYFMTLPRELDEAATVDGAGPITILWSIILPQSKPVLLAIAVFHVVFAWNDFFGPLIYLKPNTNLYPISVALQYFVGLYAQQPELVQAGALMALLFPMILFVVAQRYFIQGIVITGVEK